MSSSTKDAPPPAAAAALPPNVSIFSPAEPRTAKRLLHGRLFTRLTVGAQTAPAQLAQALQGHGTYCTSHRNVVLIFDDDDDDDDGDSADSGGGGSETTTSTTTHNKKDADVVEDAHHEHFRLVCLALKDSDISLDVAGCIFDVPNVLQAGFQLDELSSGSVLVIDLMAGGDDDDDDSDDDDDAGLETLLAKGSSSGSGATMS